MLEEVGPLPLYFQLPLLPGVTAVGPHVQVVLVSIRTKTEAGVLLFCCVALSEAGMGAQIRIATPQD